MSKLSIGCVSLILLIGYVVFYWYPNSDLIVRSYTSIEELKGGWVTLDKKLLISSREILQVSDLDSNEYLIAVKLNQRAISSLYTHFVNLKCKQSTVSYEDAGLVQLGAEGRVKVSIFSKVGGCDIDGLWLLSPEIGKAFNASSFPIDNRVLKAYRNQIR